MYISVQVIPNAKKESIEIIGENTYGHVIYKIKTTEPAIDNKANIAIKNILSKHLNVPKKNIELKHWGNWREKSFYIS